MLSKNLHAYHSTLNYLLGKELCSLRQQKLFTREEVAKELKINFNEVEEIESGLSPIGASELFKLCQVLGISLNEIFSRIFDEKITTHQG
jgi:transcriptional regulator with XRE-family HTH domain